MRKLSVVAILLGISAACSNQPTTTTSHPTEAQSKSAAGVPASPTAASAPHPFTWSLNRFSMPWTREGLIVLAVAVCGEYVSYG
jgi:hypothetical protein